MKLLLSFALGLLALSHFSSAAKINWYCPPHSVNLTEGGQVMGAEFVFELGVFKGGFIPTSENRSDWAVNWVPAQRVPYHSVNRWYTSSYYVTENTPDFAINTPAWVWGFSGGPESGEWLLLGSQSWKWPQASASSPLSLTWKASDADTVLIGSVGGSSLLRSAKVRGVVPPTTTWAQWQAQHLGQSNGNPIEDLNGNSIPDIFEFASGLEKAGQLKIVSTANGFELRIPRRVDRPAAFNIEVSYDLKDWYSGSELIRLLRSDNSELVFEDLASDENTLQMFWRYSVVPE
jgi:hypothetical protein